MTEQMVDTTPTITSNGQTRGGAITDGDGFGRATALTDAKSASTADLVKLASEQISQLVRDEVALAKVEMTTKAKRMGLGGGLFGGAGVFVFYGVGALLAGAALALALVLPAYAAALIVGGGLFLFAAICALVGRREVQRAGKPVPDQAIDSVKADVQTLSHAVKEGRH